MGRNPQQSRAPRSHRRGPKAEAVVAGAPAGPAGRRRRFHLHLSPDWLFAAALVAAVFLAYQPVWHAGFIWDDDWHLTENPCVVGPKGLKEIWTTKAAKICPLVQTTFWVEHKIWRLQPLPYHLVNLLLHAANALVLWQLLRRLGVFGAGLGAAIWALHPVQVETAAWITEMKNTQSAFFYLLAILLFANFVLAQGQADRKAALRWYWASVVCGALAMASKSSTVVLPFVLALCAYWLEGQWNWHRVWNLLPFVLLAAASAWLAAWTQGLDIAGRADWQRGWPERLAVAGRIIWFYLGKLAWPHPLIFVYPRWKIDTYNPRSYAPLMAVILMLAVLWYGRRSWARPTWFAFTYFIVALLPVLDLVNHYFVRYSFVGDHFQYLASMGILALAGGGIARLLQRFQWWRSWSGDGLCFLLLLTLAGLTWRQSRMYADDETLYRTTLERNPTCWLAHNNLGKMLIEREKVDEAVYHYQQAMEAEPREAEPHNNLGKALLKTGQTGKAIEQYNRAIELDPQYAVAHYNLGIVLEQLNQHAAAIQHFQKALDIDAEFFDAHMRLAFLLVDGRQFDEAIVHFRKAAELRPTSAEAHYFLAAVLAGRGQVAAAAAEYRKALAIKPDFAAARRRLDALRAVRQ